MSKRKGRRKAPAPPGRIWPYTTGYRPPRVPTSSRVHQLAAAAAKVNWKPIALGVVLILQALVPLLAVYLADNWIQLCVSILDLVRRQLSSSV